MSALLIACSYNLIFIAVLLIAAGAEVTLFFFVYLNAADCDSGDVIDRVVRQDWNC